MKTKPIFVPRYESYQSRNVLTSRVGASNRRENTIPELLLRNALRAAGIRYKSNVKTLPGCPDVVLARHRIVVFCDGDFWHGRNWTERKNRLNDGWNAAYWVPKIERNRQRDRLVKRTLQQMGWHVIRVWESDLRNDPARVVRKILKAIPPVPR